MSEPLKGFIAYSHKDTEQKDELRTRLAVMKDQKKLVTWHDGDITAGGKARQEDILKEVADSDILQERKVAMNWKNKTVFIGDNLNVMRGVSYGT